MGFSPDLLSPPKVVSSQQIVKKETCEHLVTKFAWEEDTMIDFVDMAVVAGMMFLRIGVPLLIVLAIGYGLKRLDRRWEAEARAREAKMASEQPGIRPQVPAPQPTVPARRPGKQPVTPQPLPFVPPAALNKESQRPVMYAQAGMSAAGKHCWDEKGCSDNKKQTCAAATHPEQPCWQARFNAEGHIPEECVHCDIFQRYPSM
jgi:hypothetical protein